MKKDTQFTNDITILKSYDQKIYNASPQVLEAASRILAAIDFRGRTKQEVIDTLGKPMRDEGTTLIFSFHNGEMGYVRRFHFDANNHVTKVEPILTQ